MNFVLAYMYCALFFRAFDKHMLHNVLVMQLHFPFVWRRAVDSGVTYNTGVSNVEPYHWNPRNHRTAPFTARYYYFTTSIFTPRSAHAFADIGQFVWSRTWSFSPLSFFPNSRTILSPTLPVTAKHADVNRSTDWRSNAFILKSRNSKSSHPSHSLAFNTIWSEIFSYFRV